MPNTLLTIGMIAKEMLMQVENNLVFAKGVRRHYDDYFGNKSAQIGDTITIKYPNRFRGRTGRVMAIEDVVHKSTSLTLDTQFGVDVEFTSKDLALSLGEFSQEYLVPAATTIANKIDSDGLKLYTQIANAVGTPGVLASDLNTYLLAGALMDEEGVPMDGQRSVLVNPRTQASVINANKNLFNPTDELAKQYKTGNMGTAVGFKWSVTQNLPTHQVGPLGGAPLVNGANQSGSTLVTDGWAASAALRLRKGSSITIAGVFAVNPHTRVSTGQLRIFTVTADVSSDASGNAQIPIYPAIDANPNSAWRNVTNTPVDNAGIAVIGGGDANVLVSLAYHKDAFALGSVDLPLPVSVGKGAYRIADRNTGLSIRVVQGYDITNDIHPTRMDVLYGWKCVYPELAVKIFG